MVRTFLAINLPDREKHKLSEAVERWRRYKAAVRWTPASRMHLTLKFLGEVEEQRIEAICEACRNVAKAWQPFELKTTVTGVFPTVKRPRILWVGLTSISQGRLQELQQAVEQGLENLGFPREEKAFSPHITVGRVKSGRNIGALMKDFMGHEPGGTAFSCDHFSLYSSTLTPRGPIYKELERFSLG